jgi:hypothetical protein
MYPSIYKHGQIEQGGDEGTMVFEIEADSRTSFDVRWDEEAQQIVVEWEREEL